MCHSTRTFYAPLRLSQNGDIEWTHYPLEPARRLSEKAHDVLRNVGIIEPDFDQYLQEHAEYRTWSPPTAPAQPVMNPSMMKPLPYSSRLDRNLKRSFSEAGFHGLDTIADEKVEDRPETKMRVRKSSQTNQTADQPAMHFVQHIPMDPDYGAPNFQLFAGEGLTQNDHPFVMAIPTACSSKREIGPSYDRYRGT